MIANFPSPIKDRDALLLARRAADLSQAELAALMGMTPNAISHIETGLTAFTKSRALHAALIFAWLKGDAKAASASAGVVLPPRAARGRPEKVLPTTRKTTYRTAEGVRIRAGMADALPVGTRLQRMSALGRDPDESRDQWEWCTRGVGLYVFIGDNDLPPLRIPTPLAEPSNTYRGAARMPDEAVERLRHMLDNPAEQKYP